VSNLPTGHIAGGVVICPSLFNEFMKNYRREVALARMLATQGVAVQRFTYYGVGNSDGDPSDMTFESMCADAATAMRRLAETAGVDLPGFVGTRFGALVAATLAGETPGAPIALVEPALRADRYFAEGRRARASAGLMAQAVGDTGGAGSDGAARPGKDDFAAKLEADGSIDMVGYALGWPLFKSSAGRSVADALGTTARRILAVQLGGGPAKPELTQLADSWRAQGSDVSLESTGEREQWWFAEERDELPGEFEEQSHNPDAEDPVLRTVADWVVATVAEGQVA
jgi:hypothetical protein